MLDEASTKDYQVYKWNIWEVVAPLPTDDPEMMKAIYKTFGGELPNNIHLANGYYEWYDLITKRKTLDDEVWQTEWLCSRPGLHGVVYGQSFTDDKNVIVADEGDDYWIPPTRGYTYLAEDFGHSESHPNVLLAVWIPTTFDRLIVYDELYLEKHNTDEIWQYGNEMLSPYSHNLPDKRLNIKGTITGWACDPHNLALIDERAARGAPLLSNNEDPKMYHLRNSIPLVRRFLQAGRLMITDKCPTLRMELLSYSWKKNADGTYSNTVTQKDNDHGPDAIRYLILALGDKLERSWLKRTYEKDRKPVDLDRKAQELAEMQRNLGKKQSTAPLTANLIDKKF
jgi:hypothetical protein